MKLIHVSLFLNTASNLSPRVQCSFIFALILQLDAAQLRFQLQNCTQKKSTGDFIYFKSARVQNVTSTIKWRESDTQRDSAPGDVWRETE